MLILLTIKAVPLDHGASAVPCSRAPSVITERGWDDILLYFFPGTTYYYLIPDFEEVTSQASWPSGCCGLLFFFFFFNVLSYYETLLHLLHHPHFSLFFFLAATCWIYLLKIRPPAIMPPPSPNQFAVWGLCSLPHVLLFTTCHALSLPSSFNGCV